jgi:hypothetical protein
MRRQLKCERLERRLAPAANYILTNEHADVQVGYAAGTWSMFVRDKDIDVDFPAGETTQYVNPVFATTIRPATPAFDFLGVPPGGPFYRLPQLQNPNLLYHGFGAESVAPGTFDAYNPAAESKGRASGVGRWIRIQLVGVNGPGTFAVFRNGDAGPIRYMSNYQDGVANPEADGVDYTDGISADDAYWMIEGAHVHLNFAFSAVGRYEVSFRPSGFVGGSLQVGPVFTFVYSVQNVGQVAFQSASYSVNEAAGLATITLTRTGGSDGAVSVDYATAGGTATPDDDYTPASGTLTFFDQEVTKSFTVPIVNDLTAEPPETIGLALTNFRPWSKPGGGPEDPPIAGVPDAATLTIIDNDSTPAVTVTDVTVNGGAAQRSRVTSVAVAFSQAVSFAGTAADAFRLRRQTDNADVALTASVAGSVVTLTFAGAGAEAGSLRDGRYTLTVFASQIPGLAADFTLVGSPAAQPKLFRLFGDEDGNGVVSTADFLAFRLAFLSGSPAFDADGDGQVAVPDFLRFRFNFLATV